MKSLQTPESKSVNDQESTFPEGTVSSQFENTDLRPQSIVQSCQLMFIKIAFPDKTIIRKNKNG